MLQVDDKEEGGQGATLADGEKDGQNRRDVMEKE